MKEVFSKSPTFKSEYSCAVVRLGELTPIEGSDFLAKTLIQGTQIVVRKDTCKEGDIVLYAANETQLNERFLSNNNLFEIGCREKNSNAEMVNEILKPYLETKPKIEELKQKAKNIKSSMETMTKRSAKLNKEVKKLEKELETIDPLSEKHTECEAAIKEKREKADEAYARALSKTTDYTNLKKEIEEMVKKGEPLVAEAKKHVGFFNKYGRVRCIVLKGEASFGYIFSVSELQKFDNSITQEDVEAYLDQEFDTVNGELFCKAFVPPVKNEERRKNNDRGDKRTKKLEKFDRLIEGEFRFHYTTVQLQKAMQYFKSDDKLTISLKKHGTSICIGKLKVRQPKKIAFYKRAVNTICKWLKKPKVYIDYEISYGPIYSSRTVIKNRYINKGVDGGYYGTDIWSEYGDMIYPYLSEGMTVYGEIIGYLTDSDKMIQKQYDYGCARGCNKLMPYRITTKLDDGSFYEWNVSEVYDWTLNLIERMTATNDGNVSRIDPIRIFYHGTLEDLYPDIDVETHWAENVLEAMKKDKEHFGMETNEDECTNTVPREGICIRIDDAEVPGCYKLKCQSFLLKEAVEVDAGFVDIEMSETNYDGNTEESEN